MKKTVASSLVLALAALLGTSAMASDIDPYTGINVKELRSAMAKTEPKVAAAPQEVAPTAAPAVAAPAAAAPATRAQVKAQYAAERAATPGTGVDPYTGVNVKELRDAMGRPAKQ
jgi:hypothetical protein